MDWTFTDDRPIWQQITEQLTLRIQGTIARVEWVS